MVKIRTTHSDGPFYKTFAYLYETLATRPFPELLGCHESADMFATKPFVLEGVWNFLEAVYEACGQKKLVAVQTDYWPRWTGAKANNEVLLGFSGGKDSVAMALKLRHAGFSPELFFVHGINKSYRDEIHYARQAAEALDMYFHVEEMVVSGKTDFVENPIKNFVILASMVDYGVYRGIRRYAMGSDAHLGSTVNPEYDLSDAIELYDILRAFYQEYIPSFELRTEITSATDAFFTIWQHAPEIMRNKVYSSCILPEFRKPNVRKANMRKGIALEAARCGSCAKCAKEYLHDVIFGFQPFNREYAVRCVENIAKRDYQENARIETFFDHESVDIEFLKTHLPIWADFDPKGDNFIDALERKALR